MRTKADIVAAARSYLGTPFHHRGRKPGVGIDCAGVLVCAARDCDLVSAAFDVPAYSPIPNGNDILQWCDLYMKPVSREEIQPGDAILIATDVYPQHLGILGDYVRGGLSIIHASDYTRPPRVIETRLLFARAMRFVAAYELPGIG